MMFHFFRGHVLSSNRSIKVSKAMAALTRTYRGSECRIAARSVVAVPSAVPPRLQFIQAWAKNQPKCPSEQGEAQNFNTLQLTDRRIEWTRPPDGTLPIPVTLLHPIFGQFVDDCGTHEPTSEDNSFVLELSLRMAEFFENEAKRQDAFIKILRGRHIGIVPSSVTGYITDGDVHVNARRYMILEVKSEVGSKGAEPYCQAILYYIEASKDEAKKAFEEDVQFNFPCLIVTLFGGFYCESSCQSADETPQVLTSVSRAQCGRTAPITKSSPLFCLCSGIRPIPRCANLPLVISVHSRRPCFRCRNCTRNLIRSVRTSRTCSQSFRILAPTRVWMGITKSVSGTSVLWKLANCSSSWRRMLASHSASSLCGHTLGRYIGSVQSGEYPHC